MRMVSPGETGVDALRALGSKCMVMVDVVLVVVTVDPE
jgi:hypothetical protein